MQMYVCELYFPAECQQAAWNERKCVNSAAHAGMQESRYLQGNEIAIVKLIRATTICMIYATITANICKSIYCKSAGVQMWRYVYALFQPAHSYGERIQRKLPQICNNRWKEKCCTKCNTNAAYVQVGSTVLFVYYTLQMHLSTRLVVFL